MKTGWWKVHFDVTLDGVDIDFDELPVSEKRRIQRLLAFGTVAGEVTVPTTGEDGPWIGDIVRLNFVARWGKSSTRRAAQTVGHCTKSSEVTDTETGITKSSS